MRTYELMYIVRPDLDEEALDGAVTSVHSILESHGGEVLGTTMWGKRRLAYEVKHLRDGFYVIDDVRLEATSIGAVESALRIHDQVFRHMLVLHEGPIESESHPTAAPEPEVAAVEAPGPVLNEEELDAVPAAVDAEDL